MIIREFSQAALTGANRLRRDVPWSGVPPGWYSAERSLAKLPFAFVGQQTELASTFAPVAVIYQATLVPSKIELLQGWVPDQPWLGDADASAVELAGAYRFDDPDGEVGIETHLLRTADGQILQVPVTYRGAPADDAESLLIATTQHSVLGERWVYDACGDPVYAKALGAAVLGGGTQAELEVVTNVGQERRQATTRVWGSGSPDTAMPPIGQVFCSSRGTTTAIRTGNLELTLFRTVDPHREMGEHGATQTLEGTWPGHETPALLALAQIT
jgi:Maltokinase N-terminal cap domain